MSIAERALLVRLSISRWSNRVSDGNLTKEIANKYGVDNHEDRYIKALLPKTAVANVNSAAEALRKFHKSNTLAWGDDNTRILASKNFMKYREGMAKAQEVFEHEVNTLMEHYTQWIEYTLEHRKDMFDPKQYPTKEELRTKYGVCISFLPFPDASDFRIEEVKAEAQAKFDAMVKSSTNYLFSRILERLEKLWFAVNKETSMHVDIFYNRLIETADTASQLDVSDSKELAHVIEAVKNITLACDPSPQIVPIIAFIKEQTK